MALRLNYFNWLIPSGFHFFNTFYVLDVWRASIYIPRDLERVINNMGQIFKEKTFSYGPTTLEPFSSYNIIFK
jgi:hypothetical protein